MEKCCADHCRDWRETDGGKYPASIHSPGCHNFKLKKFKKLSIGGSWLVDVPEFIEDHIREFKDSFEDNDFKVEDIFLTQDQFEKLPEFDGF